MSEARDNLSRKPGLNEPPLSLADSNSDRTHMTQRSDDSTRTPRPVRQPKAALSAGDSAAEGASTGGFETMLGKIVVERGLATSDDVQHCADRVKESAGNDDPRMLADLLVTGGFVTERQLARLREEFERARTDQGLRAAEHERRIADLARSLEALRAEADARRREIGEIAARTRRGWLRVLGRTELVRRVRALDWPEGHRPRGGGPT